MQTIQTILEKAMAEQTRSTELLVRELEALSEEFKKQANDIQIRISSLILAAQAGYRPSIMDDPVGTLPSVVTKGPDRPHDDF